MNAVPTMTRDDIINALSVQGDRYGNLLLALLDRWGVIALKDITHEQAQKFWEEINQ